MRFTKMLWSATYILRNSILIKLLWHQSKANLTTYYILRQIKSEERLCKNYSFVLLKKRFCYIGPRRVRSFCYGSSPNCNWFAGLRFGFVHGLTAGASKVFAPVSKNPWNRNGSRVSCCPLTLTLTLTGIFAVSPAHLADKPFHALGVALAKRAFHSAALSHSADEKG